MPQIINYQIMLIRWIDATQHFTLREVGVCGSLFQSVIADIVGYTDDLRRTAAVELFLNARQTSMQPKQLSANASIINVLSDITIVTCDE